MTPRARETKRPTVAAAEEILGGYFPVLDHGFVALVDYMGTDESIERAARVSYGYGTRAVSATRGLVRYLRRHLHTTPSEMVEFKFHCSMPMFVARQWVRHRTACLAADTMVHLEAPDPADAGRWVARRMPIARLWSRFRAEGADRFARVRVRQMDEDARSIGRARVADVHRNGVRPVFRMFLEDGRTIDATADHRFLFAEGWSALGDAVDLKEVDGRAVWSGKVRAVYVDGAPDPAASGLASADHGALRPAGAAVGPSWAASEALVATLDAPPPATRTPAKLARVSRFEYVGERETYDVEVEGPYRNFVANGVVTHNSVNEYSGRYSLMPLLFYSPEPEQFALQSETRNQGRAEGSARADVHREAVRRWDRARARAGRDYAWLVGENVARELARIDLPLSTYTQWYWKIDLHNLLHFLSLRVDDHAQWEIREFARVMAGMVKRVAPLSYEAWIDYQVLGDRLARGEIAALAALLAADADGVAARPGARVSNAALAELGLSAREIRELKRKLTPRAAPDHDLDLGEMLKAEEMEARIAKRVPGGEPSPES